MYINIAIFGVFLLVVILICYQDGPKLSSPAWNTTIAITLVALSVILFVTIDSVFYRIILYIIVFLYKLLPLIVLDFNGNALEFPFPVLG